MDWNVEIRRSGRSLVLTAGGRYIEVEVERRAFTVAWGSLVAEARDVLREHAEKEA